MTNKLIATTMALTMAATAAVADPRDDGKFGGGFDFAMQNELNSSVGSLQHHVNRNEKQARAGIASAGSLALLPKVDGAVAVSVATYEDEQALSMGYTKSFGAESKHHATVGLSVDTESNTLLGLGYAYKF